MPVGLLFFLFTTERLCSSNKARSILDVSLFTIHSSLGRSPLERSVSHATGGSQCRHESCESGYYHLHHYLNNTILLHNSQLSIINFQLSTSVALAKRLISVSQVLVTRIRGVRGSGIRAARCSAVLIVLDVAVVRAGHALHLLAVAVVAGDDDSGVLQLV